MTEQSRRETAIRQRLNAIGHEAFPDNPEVNWVVEKIEHQEGISIVEVRPDGGDVGYPRFQFVLSFPSAGSPSLKRCFCWNKGKWELLFE